MSRTVLVLGGSAGLAALLAARLSVSIAHAQEVPLGIGDDETERRDLSVLLGAATAQRVEPAPVPYSWQSGKQKAQWKRERAGRKS